MICVWCRRWGARVAGLKLAFANVVGGVLSPLQARNYGMYHYNLNVECQFVFKEMFDPQGNVTGDRTLVLVVHDYDQQQRQMNFRTRAELEYCLFLLRRGDARPNGVLHARGREDIWALWARVPVLPGPR